MNITLEISVILALTFLNGVFSMAELAVVSARRPRLQELAQTGHKGAVSALKLSDSPARFLSTVQIGITVVTLIAGAFSGSRVAAAVSPVLIEWGVPTTWANTIAFSLTVAFVTILTTVLGELVPKQIALRHPERIATWVARPMFALSQAMSPLITMLTVSSNLVLGLLGQRSSSNREVTREEVRHLISEATEAGVIHSSGQELLERTLRFADSNIQTFMIPRQDVEWLDSGAQVEEMLETLAASNLSYLLVCQDVIDNVRGYVAATKLLSQVARREHFDVTPLLLKPIYVHENMSAIRTLQQMSEQDIHVAVVHDEYGGVSGVVDLDNFVSALLLGVHPQTEEDESLSAQRPDGSWLVSGLMPIDQFCYDFDIEALPENEQGTYQTLAGFVIARMGRIPAVADQVEWNHLRIEVMDLDGRRVDKLLVSRIDETHEEVIEDQDRPQDSI